MSIFELNYDGTGTAELEGFTLQATLEPDTDHGPPWKEEDGHGPVTDWTRRSKAPGELVLSEDRGSFRYYDFQEACRIARAESWGSKGDEGLTPRAKAAKAARADFERLQAWANDDWRYVGVIVTASRHGTELGSASLWGIEDDSGDYLQEVADQLASEAIDNAKEQLERLCCAQA